MIAVILLLLALLRGEEETLYIEGFGEIEGRWLSFWLKTSWTCRRARRLSWLPTWGCTLMRWGSRGDIGTALLLLTWGQENDGSCEASQTIWRWRELGWSPGPKTASNSLRSMERLRPVLFQADRSFPTFSDPIVQARVADALMATGETRRIEDVPEEATRTNPLRSETTYVDFRVPRPVSDGDTISISVQARGGGEQQVIELDTATTVAIYSLAQ